MPAFTIVATITLALGIGATSAMFTLVNGILLRPLPYPNADRLVRLIQSYPEKGLDTWGISQVNIALYRDRSTDFEAFAAYRTGARRAPPSGPARLSASRVTADFFHVLGVSPVVRPRVHRGGRHTGKEQRGAPQRGAWQTRFGGDPSVVGKDVEIDEQPLRIIGVMPAGFAFPRPDVKLWIPMGLDPTRRFGFFNSGLGSVKPGVSLEHVRRQTTAIMWDWARREPGLVNVPPAAPEKTRMATLVAPLQEAVTGTYGAAAHGAARGSHADPPHRHRERRDLALEPRRDAGARDRSARGARRHRLARVAPVAHGKCRACTPWRRDRHGLAVAGPRARHALDSRRCRGSMKCTSMHACSPSR